MIETYLFDAIRTPRTKGKPDGSFAKVSPYELINQLVIALRKRNGAEAIEKTQRLSLGCVTQVGAQGGHVALMARTYSGLPDTAVASTINNYCVSGLSALAVAVRTISSGEEYLAIAGGVECMSQAIFEGDKATFFNDSELAARLRYVSPPIVADLLATLDGITRAELDTVTINSHRSAGIAWNNGHYHSTVIPISLVDGTLVERDELVRPNLTLSDLERFTPAFDALGAMGHDAQLLVAMPKIKKINHIHSVAHCPPIADGASLLLIGSAIGAATAGLKPRARIAGITEINTNPLDPFAAGFACIDRLLQRSGLKPKDIGAIEFMEAFAAVPVKFLRQNKFNPSIVNASGGHLAMGHPMGASGAILVATLLAEMERRDVEWGIAVAHAVSGVGAGVLLQRCT